MTQASHTPGPWSLVDDEWDGIFVQVPQSHKFVCEVTATNPVYTTPGYDISKEEALANARLIAAAPELLSLARKLLTVAEDWPMTKAYRSQLIEETKAVIAKVTGEERKEA